MGTMELTIGATTPAIIQYTYKPATLETHYLLKVDSVQVGGHDIFSLLNAPTIVGIEVDILEHINHLSKSRIYPVSQ